VGSRLEPSRPFPVQLAVMDAAGRGVRVLASLGTAGPRWQAETAASDKYRPMWSPDGRYLVARHVDGHLLLFRSDGSEAGPLPRDYAEASWSPQANRLALLDREGRRIQVIEVDSSSTADEMEAVEYFRRHDDKEYSAIDCLSFVVMLKHGIAEAFSSTTTSRIAS